MPDPRAALERLFRFRSFRPGQREAVDAALADRDVLLVMPTGSGKSLCYQLPALMRSDLTVVVSPLVSLMQDQVERLEDLVPGRAAIVNSQQGPDANRRALERALQGDLRLLYVAPERFASPGFAEALRAARLGLFVVDEAHCVSQWGHDFRPDYFRLADAARFLGARALFASTATATPQVSTDIARRLGLRSPARVITGFDRPNLSFAVARCSGGADKHRRLVAALSGPQARPAIVYSGTRATSDKLARSLTGELGVEAVAYHAGLSREQRATAQRRFMSGEVEVVVATNAFGMGVDKADVRTVCHETVPQSLEAFYQEAGRAGRDGASARCLLLAESRDKGLHVFFIQRAAVDERRLTAIARRAAGAAVDGRYDLGLRDVCGGAECSEDQARAVFGHLARAGVLQPTPSPPDRVTGRVLGPLEGRAMAICRTSLREAERVRWRHYRTVWGFVEGDGCRREAILRHFGDRAAPVRDAAIPCCDVCSPELVPGPAPRERPRGSKRSGAAGFAAAGSDDLDQAILAIVGEARPAVGRTRAVEILRGGRSRPIRDHSYDGLPAYGRFNHLPATELLERVDGLLDSGALRSTGGRFPKLAAA